MSLSTGTVTTAEPIAIAPASPAPGRSAALDMARGIAIVGMVFVNNPGSERGPRQLVHAAWNGATVADFVFPAFLFVMGISMSWSFARRRRHSSHAAIALRIARRAAVLIALGVLLNALIPLAPGPLRYPGVLQRIAVSYAIAALVLFFRPRVQLAVAVTLVVGYWWFLVHVSVPGFGAGVLTPAGNAAGWVDRSVFGQAHLYRHLPYDPEGIGSLAGAVATVLLGALAGEWLRLSRRAVAGAGLAAAGLVVAASGWVWSQSMPVNKRIWSPSYVLWTAGLLAVGFAVLWEVVDVRGWRWLQHPWAVLGSNALVLYVVTELGDRGLGLVHIGGSTLHVWSYRHWFVSWLPASTASVVWSIAFVSLAGIASAVLYRRGILLRV